MKTPFIKGWRGPVEEDRRFMYRVHGGNFMCPAILGACGPAMAKDHEGEFWYSISGRTQYTNTFEAAKAAVEKHYEDQYSNE